MAATTTFIDNFPVKFNNTEDSCVDYDQRDFCQLAQWADRFEFAIRASTTDISVTNGTFTGSLTGWTAGAGWTYNSGRARLTNNTGELEQAVTHTVGEKYKITFTVSNYNSLNGATDGLYVAFGDALMSAYIPEGIKANGTYSIYLTPTTSANLKFACITTNTSLDLDDVTVELVNDSYYVAIYDSINDDYVGTVLAPNLTYAYSDYIGWSYNWSDFGISTEGCYKIALLDIGSTNLISNGEFTSNSIGWTLGGAASWDSAGYIKFSTSGSELSQSISAPPWVAGELYLSKFTLGYLIEEDPGVFFNQTSGDLEGTGNFEVRIFDSALSTDYTTAGQKIQLGIANDSLTIYFKKENATAPYTAWTVDNVELYKPTIYLSECYNLKTTHNCTKLLKWTNNTTSGFNYPYNYFYDGTKGFHHMRIECDLRSPKYTGQLSTYDDNGGNQILYYFNNKKIKKLFINEIPEYMHDAIAIGVGHKEFYIDGSRYVVSETDYTPEWSDKPPLLYAKSQILVSKYTQDKKSID